MRPPLCFELFALCFELPAELALPKLLDLFGSRQSHARAARVIYFPCASDILELLRAPIDVDLRLRAHVDLHLGLRAAICHGFAATAEHGSDLPLGSDRRG